MGQSDRQPGTGTRAERERIALLAARALVDRARALYRELEQRTGAPVQAHRALSVIAAEPGIQSSRLAETLGMQRSALSHLLRTLAERQWIERRRHGEDQRSVHLFVTAAGRSIVGATSGRMVGVLQHAVEQLDDTQLGELGRSLQALLQHVEAPAPRVARPSRQRRRRPHPR